MSDQTTSACPVFQPRPAVDGVASAYLAWRLAGNVLAVESGCWEWQGTGTGKYGHIDLKHWDWPERAPQIHRVVYMLCVGELTPGLFVCHKCDNPRCLRPDHLFLGTNQDNTDDKVTKGRQARGQAVRKNHEHLKGEAVVTAVLTAEEVMDIRRASLAGESRRSISARTGVSVTQLGYIIAGRAWAHLPILQPKMPKFHRPCPHCGESFDARFGGFTRHIQTCG